MIGKALLSLVAIAAVIAPPAAAQDDARMKQLRLLCAQLSGDLTDPGGIAAFRRCLTTRDPLGEIKRDNNIGGRAVARAVDRPNAKPPRGYGADSRKLAAEGIHGFTTLDGRMFYGVDKDGTVWRWDVVTKKASAIDHNTAAVEMIDPDHVLALDKAGVLWREAGDGTSRTGVDRGVASFQGLSPDLIYVLSRDGQLWRERTGATRAVIDRRVKAFQVIDADIVYVLGTDGVLWRETGDARNGTQVAQQVTAFQYVPSGDTLLVVTGDATLWRKEGKGDAQRIDRGVAAFHAVDPHLAYVLGQDGRLWRQEGNRDRALLVDRALMVSVGAAAFQAIDAQHVVVLAVDYKLWSETMP